MYEVTRDYEVAEFGIVLVAGDTVYDGDLEADLTAQLVASGVLEVQYGDGPADDGNDYLAVDEEAAGAE